MSDSTFVARPLSSAGAPIIVLPGATALSSFRLTKLNATLAARVSGMVVNGAQYLHVVELNRALTDTDRALLLCVLDHGEPFTVPPPGGASLIVAPRIGTLSPWSSKATDIARNCGLAVIRRVERVTRYYFSGGSAVALGPWVHDRMTESLLASQDDCARLFQRVEPRPLASIPIASITAANVTLGLALAPDEIAYLTDYFVRIGRDPTDAELTMFAQANSEHCRHKIFNADWRIDGHDQPRSLFAMIRTTHTANPQGTIVAYSDNAAIMEGSDAARWFADVDGQYRVTNELTHIVMKVETHNHPTAISPFPGAATGAGGELRDEGATGRGAKPKAGLCGFSVSNLRLPQAVEPWERDFGRPDRITSALDIMIAGPIGAASFNNEFGRPNLAGYFRAYEEEVDGTVRGYHKPIMIAGGIGAIRPMLTHKLPIPSGALLVQLGGPGMLIGMGGGAASSMATGLNAADLDFDSVQRGNAEMQRRAQEVIDRCIALGAASPILAIHDVGAGGLSNALPELVNDADRGAAIALRDVPTETSGMSPREIWSNESQERYVLAILADRLDCFSAICERERAPFAVVGRATAAPTLTVTDTHFDNRPVQMEMATLLGKPPRMLRDVVRKPLLSGSLDTIAMTLEEACYRVLRAPTVGSKSFLITIGDRTVGGLCARDQMVGPWQVPVADCAATLADFVGYSGEAYAMGERAPVAVLDAPAAGRMAVGEALTNLAAAPVTLERVKLSANWMAAAGVAGEDAALFDTVSAVALELCPQLGVAIPVGKDSLSMRTMWHERGVDREVVSPVSLIVSAFAHCHDVRAVWTPQLRTDAGPTELLLIDLAAGQQRLGGSMLAQVFNQTGGVAPDVVDAESIKQFFAFVSVLRTNAQVLAYHDRSDGGLWATVCEMAFAGRSGVTINLDMLAFDDKAVDVDGYERRPEVMRGRAEERVLAALFNEELGAVIQVRAPDRRDVLALARTYGVAAQLIGHLNDRDEVCLIRNAKPLLSAPRATLQQTWSHVSHVIAQLRDNPAAADAEFDRIALASDPGLHAVLGFNPLDDVAAPFINRGARPRVAILREQGVNGQLEMAAAFDRAGFAAHDVHMSDLIAGRTRLSDFAGFAACGGFSYGDVLGAGQGWAKSILFNHRTRDEFARFFDKSASFALGLCNGCQMMAHLTELIPGAAHWPTFETNTSEQFEARLVMVEVVASPSIFFNGMHGSRMPIATAHGEGRAVFRSDADRAAAKVALRFVDNHGQATEAYPANPNGSTQGITGLTTADGRFTILMPHPERVFRSVQMSWHPAAWGEASPWLRMFQNARAVLG